MKNLILLFHFLMAHSLNIARQRMQPRHYTPQASPIPVISVPGNTSTCFAGQSGIRHLIAAENRENHWQVVIAISLRSSGMRTGRTFNRIVIMPFSGHISDGS